MIANFTSAENDTSYVLGENGDSVEYTYYYDEYYDDPESTINGIRICSGPMGAYVNRNRVVWFSNVYCIPFIAVMGILCNILNIVVLYRKKGRRVPSGTYLFTLAMCDCLFLVFGTLEVTPITLDSLSQNPLFNQYYTFSVLYIRWMSSTCFKSGVLLVIAFNVERYIWVCYPLQAQRFCTRKVQLYVLAFIIIFSALMGLQWPLCYEVDSCFNLDQNQTFYVIKRVENIPLLTYNKIMNYVTMLLFNIIPIGTVLILNCMIIKTLRRVLRRDMSIWSPYQETTVVPGEDVHEALRKRSSVSATYSGGTSVAWSANAILFAVVLMFMLCLGPQIPARILFELYGPSNDLVFSYMAISQQLIFLNASLNFCLYCLVSRKYRQLLKRTIKRIWQTINRVSNGSSDRYIGEKRSGRRLSAAVQSWMQRRKPVKTMPVEECEEDDDEIEEERERKPAIVTFFVGWPDDKRVVHEIVDNESLDQLQPTYV